MEVGSPVSEYYSTIIAFLRRLNVLSAIATWFRARDHRSETVEKDGDATVPVVPMEVDDCPLINVPSRDCVHRVWMEENDGRTLENTAESGRWPCAPSQEPRRRSNVAPKDEVTRCLGPHAFPPSRHLVSSISGRRTEIAIVRSVLPLGGFSREAIAVRGARARDRTLPSYVIFFDSPSTLGRQWTAEDGRLDTFRPLSSFSCTWSGCDERTSASRFSLRPGRETIPLLRG